MGLKNMQRNQFSKVVVPAGLRKPENRGLKETDDQKFEDTFREIDKAPNLPD